MRSVVGMTVMLGLVVAFVAIAGITDKGAERPDGGWLTIELPRNVPIDFQSRGLVSANGRLLQDFVVVTPPDGLLPGSEVGYFRSVANAETFFGASLQLASAVTGWRLEQVSVNKQTHQRAGVILSTATARYVRTGGREGRVEVKRAVPAESRLAAPPSFEVEGVPVAFAWLPRDGGDMGLAEWQIGDSAFSAVAFTSANVAMDDLRPFVAATIP